MSDQADLYLGHPRELVDMAVVIPTGHFVQLDDFLFEQHGLGPRIARVQTLDHRGHRSLSYAYMEIEDTNYDLITSLDNPQDLGLLEDLATDEHLLERLTITWISRTDYFPTHQQLAIALLRARAEHVQAGDELGLHRLVKWAATYERRAFWIITNRQKAYAQAVIDWPALGL